MKLQYKCKCLVNEVEIEVRERLPDEIIVHWVETVVGYAIGNDHNNRSPTCREKTVEYVKIPVPENAPYIGSKPRMNS